MTNKIQYKIKSSKELPEKQTLIQLSISESNPMYIIHKSIVQQLHKQRQGNANCKTRSEVKGGGKKPWKQKGTGKARAGSIRSPLWRGGGIIFGPKTKQYKSKINKKEKQLAISNLLYNKKDFTTAIGQSFFKLDEPKTKLFLQKIHELKLDNQAKFLIVIEKKDKNLYLATKNLKNIEIITANQLNSLSIIKAKYILIEINTIKTIQERYHG